ncbi:MAG: DNA topoisomerase 4 subunit B [Alphaproteobacteria bacterium]|nr:MAG: DNA topoisomerase 4 subunit B [Alphaproteobacteria bacterium]
MAKKSTYNAKDIEVLEGLEPVRKRPGMYIGSTNQDGLHHLVNEVLDNSIDEVLAGHATDISFQYKKDGSIKIKDNGRGIPIDFHPKYKNKRALEVVLTTLHAGGKFNSNAYKTSGGLHGVGISVVNALSSLLQVQVFKDGKVYRQDYSKGKVKTKIKIEKCSKKLKGTEISFIPDESIFEETQFVPKKLYNFINMKSVLVGGTTINFEIDKELIKDKTPNKKSFFYKKGIEDYFQLEYANNSKLFEKNFLLKSKIKDNENFETLISFNTNENSSLMSYCNTIETPDGGSHENGIRNGILKAIKLYGQKNQFSKISNINHSDIFDYSNVIISIFINDPSFEGQTKKRIIMPNLQKEIETKTQQEFLLWLNANKKNSKILLDNLIERALQRTDLSKIKELDRKSIKERNRLPGKLVDCSSKSIKDSEIFIVEGDSAGGSAKQARNREFQAILPLRGKILNVYNVGLSKIADNNEIQNLIQSLGCGIGKNFEISKLRYEKIILMTDADVDGSHIATLLITFFYKYMKSLIDENKLYLAMPPLFKIYNKNKSFYAYDEKEKDKLIEKEFKSDNYNITRFKGLGEMPADQLKETTMDQNKRNLILINSEKAKKDMKNTESLFETLMGKQAELRFKFIQNNANFIKNLDV